MKTLGKSTFAKSNVEKLKEKPIFFKYNLKKDWFFFGLAILVVNSLIYLIVGLVFEVELEYYSILVNILFTFLFYIIFSGLFDYYQKVIFGGQNV